MLSAMLSIALVLPLFAVQSHKRKATPPKAKTLTARQIAERISPSVVLLIAEDEKGELTSLGSGFFIKQNIIATNHHVVEGAAKIYAKIVNKKGVFKIKYVGGIDKENDVALLYVEGVKGSPLPLGNLAGVGVGDGVFVVGNPEGLEGTLSQGIVSALRGMRHMQITAPISHGSSGSPVVNDKGEVIGIAVGAMEGGQNLNFAIRVTHLSELLKYDLALEELVRGLPDKTTNAEIVAPSEWTEVGSDDHFVYYIYERKSRVAVNVVHVVIMGVLSGSDEASMRAYRGELARINEDARYYYFDHELAQHECNCLTGECRVTKRRSYTDLDQAFDVYSNPSARWYRIQPETIGALVYKAACK